ncbi:MAG: EscN/YscN/HrcN family type III secretion system ATPase, partial [bacterium]
MSDQTVLDKADRIWEKKPEFRLEGRVCEVKGVIAESIGPDASVGDLCRVLQTDGRQIDAEVVGFRDDHLQLMPVGEMHGISSESRVISTGKPFQVRAGEHLLGRVVNGEGKP